MDVSKIIPALLIGALGLAALGPLAGCDRKDGAAASSTPGAAAAVAAASSAEASASDAQASAAIARAKVRSAGTVANAAGLNQKAPQPRVSVTEELQAAGDEAPQELKDRVNAARDAGRAPARK